MLTRESFGERNNDLSMTQREFLARPQNFEIAAAVFESSSVIIAVVDPDRRYVFVSRAYAELIDSSRTAWAGVPVADILAPAVHAEVAPLLDVAFRGATTSCTLGSASRHSAPLEITVAPHQVPDQTVPFVVMTAREGASGAVVPRLEAVQRLSAALAHDLNNLLGVIRFSSELALSAADAGNPVVTSALERSIESARRGSDLIRDMLVFAGRQALAPELIDLRLTLEELEPTLRDAFVDDIEMRFDLSSDAQRCYADSEQLERMFISLVVNAVVGRTETRTVIIATRAVGDFVVISVIDDGAGLSTDAQDRLFEPFSAGTKQGQRSSSEMAAVYGFVTQSGGHLAVASAPGDGTRIDVFLPMDAPSPEPIGAPEGSARRRHILVVDNNAELAEVLALHLELSGNVVMRAESPAMARDVFDNHDFDVLLADVTLARVDAGVELARSLKAARPDLTVVMMSGDGSRVSKADLSELGATFLSKPFATDELLGMIASSPPVE